jgi:Glycosyl hydrolase family 57
MVRKTPMTKPLSLLFHANLQYAEIPRKKIADVVKRSYEPIADMLWDHPKAFALFEFSGYTLMYLERYFPSFIDKVNGLMRRGTVEVIGSTLYNPILGKTREDYMRLHIQEYLALHERLFGTHPAGFYPQEYSLDGRVPDALSEAGIEWSLVWVEHCMKHLPRIANIADPEERKRAADEYLRGSFQKPVILRGERGNTLAGLPIHGWQIDATLAASDGAKSIEEYVGDLELLTRTNDPEGDGFLVIGPADWEFVNSEFTHKHKPISPEWLAKLLLTIEKSDTLSLESPTEHLRRYPPKEEVVLAFGGGFPTFDIWIKGSEALDRICGEAMERIDIAERSIREKKFASGARRDVARAKSYLLHAHNSDYRGWNPLPERREEGLAMARKALHFAEQAIEKNTL